MVTKNEGVREGDSKSASVWHCGDGGLFYIWTCTFSINNQFPFPLATVLLLGVVMMNRRSGVKMFLLVITEPLVLAQLIDPFNCKFQIWSATPIQNINTSAPILLALWMFISWIRNGKLVSSYWPKFAALSLFVETMPIYKAVATGNRKNELYRETACSNWKYPSITTMPDYSRITVVILTLIIFCYHLPLNLLLTLG